MKFLIFFRLGHMHENKIFFFVVFLYICFATFWRKNKYFNNEFVYLQCKNTNQKKLG